MWEALSLFRGKHNHRSKEKEGIHVIQGVAVTLEKFISNEQQDGTLILQGKSMTLEDAEKLYGGLLQ